MNLNEHYTETEVRQLLNLSLYDLKKLRPTLKPEKVGRKYWYNKTNINDWASTNLSDLKQYEQTRRKLDSEATEVSTNDFLPVSEIYNVWPYSRERLSQLARTSQKRKPVVSRISANKHWLYNKDSTKRWLLEHTEEAKRKESYRKTENGTVYGSFEQWLEAVKQW